MMHRVGYAVNIAITSAKGYVATALIPAALAQKYNIKCLARQASNISGVSYAYYDLQTLPDQQLLEGVDVLIHLAAYTKDYDQDTHRIELLAAQRLLALAKDKGIFLIYVSSLSASASSPTQYGRTKHAIELLMLDQGAAVVRPGFIFGGEEKGLYGFLCHLVCVCPILPDFRPTLYFQPIHIEDLCRGLLAVAQRREAGAYDLALPELISLTKFLKLLARERIGKKRIFLPVPWQWMAVLSKWIKQVVPVGIDFNRLRALHHNKFVDTSPTLSLLNLQLRNIDEGLKA